MLRPIDHDVTTQLTALMGHDDLYQVLGVARDATGPEIRRAYRHLARRHHPDRNPQPDGPERFRMIAEAYAVLNDPVRRARYDHTVTPRSRRDPRRGRPGVPTRRGVLELSDREAQLAAFTSLTLTTAEGVEIILPAGVAAGDQLTFTVPEGRILLTVQLNRTQKA